MKKSFFIKFLLAHSIFFGSLFAVWGQDDNLDSRQSVSSRRVSAPAAVAPYHDTLFYVYTGTGPFTEQERAAKISESIRGINKKYKLFQADSLIVFSEGGIYEITYRDVILMTVTEADAQRNNKTLLALTSEYENIIREAILQRYKDIKLTTILMRMLWVLIIVVSQYFLFKLVNRLFRKISDRIAKLKGSKIKTIKFKSYTLMDEEKTIKFILFLIRILRYIVIFLMLYLSVPLAFSIFPATKGFANILWSYVLTPFKSMFTSVIEYIDNLIAIIVTIVVFRYLIRGLRFMTEEIDKKRLSLKGFYSDWAYPTFHIVKTLLYAFMFVVIWPSLPFSDSKVFQGVSVFIGIIFTLGSSSLIGNIVSGLVLTYMRPFKIGDRIKIGDLVGNVMEKTPLVTRLRTPKNEEVTIPNSNIMTALTFNYSESARTWGLILHTTVGVDYDVPWREAHALLIEAAKRTPDVQDNPKPFILQTALDDFYVQYQLNVYIIDADKMALIHSGLHQNIQDVFNEAGIELLSPHYQAHRDGSHTTIPTSYVPEGYQPSPINVKINK